MGIPGIYQEIGPGKRVALVKLAIEKYEETGRPFRVAIDTSIWSFQVQAAQGGTNPALRTLYYRLLRLLSVSVQPLFVFDGPNKPVMKRNKHTARSSASIPDMMFKQLLKYFGFPYHTAPGEAEAECALLQRDGLVDAVLSEDVDTLMFGCGVTLRNWSSEVAKGKVPTHVNVYDAQITKQGKSGLDRAGMILVALLSGGDYDTDGVRGFGVKAACQAARAGFGKSLCQISRTDAAGYAKWRENFNHEVRTNESKFFKSKHNVLRLADDFPKMDILGYYTHPVVSNARKIDQLRDEVTWDGEIDIVGLRRFVADAFEWRYKIGANKFIRGLAPVLLIHKLRVQGDRRASGFGDVLLTAMNEMELVRAICGKREHFSTDFMPEIRVIIRPNDIVELDLDAEEDFTEDYGRDGLAPQMEDDQAEAYVSENAAERYVSPIKRTVVAYDPTEPEKLWIAETIAKIGIPLKVEDYEESLRNPRKFLKQKAKEKQTAAKKVSCGKAIAGSGMPARAMDKFVKVTKAVPRAPLLLSHLPSTQPDSSSQLTLPIAYLASTLTRPSSSQPITRPASTQAVSKCRTTGPKAKVAPSKIMAKFQATTRIADTTMPSDPWSLSKSRSTRSQMRNFESRPNAKSIDSSPTSPSPTIKRHLFNSSPIDLCSSPPREPATPSRKHVHSPHLSDEEPPPHSPSHSSPIPTSSNFQQSALTPEQDLHSPSPRKRRTPRLSSSVEKITARDLIFAPNPLGHSSRSYDTSITPLRRKLDFTSLAATQGDAQDPESEVIKATNSQKTIDPEPFSSPTKPTTMFIKADYDSVLLSSPIIPQPSRASMADACYGKEEVGVETQIVLRGGGTLEMKEKKYILLRESLPGTWKEVTRDQLLEGRSRAWRKSGIEIVDMSASPD